MNTNARPDRQDRRCCYWCGGSLVALLVLAVIALIFHTALLTAAGRAIERDDSLTEAGLTGVVLMGDNSLSRARKALDLLQAGKVTRLVLMREKDLLFPGTPSAIAPADVYRDYFYAQGVDVAAVTFIADCGTTSTFEEATCVAEHLKREGALPSTLVIITHWTHSARAAWTFENVLPAQRILAVAAPIEDVTPANWWQHEAGVLSVFNEYLKWSYWLVRGFKS